MVQVLLLPEPSTTSKVLMSCFEYSLCTLAAQISLNVLLSLTVFADYNLRYFECPFFQST